MHIHIDPDNQSPKQSINNHGSQTVTHEQRKGKKKKKKKPTFSLSSLPPLTRASIEQVIIKAKEDREK